MKTIHNSELDRLIAAGKILEQDAHGPKVVLLAEHRYLKIFYHKNRLSTARLLSRATQFSRNAAKLKKRGITTIGILDTFKTKHPRRDCVCYHGIPGDTVRDRLKQQPQDLTLSRQVGSYIAHLHDAGVMFRSLHFGNIIQLPTGQLGLIDIADMRLNVFTLNNSQRRRNFQHVFRYQQDLDVIQLDAFTEGYVQESGCGGKRKAFIEQAIRSAQPQVM
jgi:tRNA A-37 threonylcarbamoyl transferase component Bud32